MTVRTMDASDLDWAVEILARRRGRLTPFAPVYWRPAADARERQREFLAYLLGEGGGVGLRTDRGLMIAAPSDRGWSVDDAWVPDDRWEQDGVALWTEARARVGEETVRFVCPVFEPDRVDFAVRRGMTLATSWWHRVVGTREPDEDAESEVVGAQIATVPAPPVYDPGGPVLFVHDVSDPRAIDRAAGLAGARGHPLVVVDQPAGAVVLASALEAAGFVRHCDFFLD